MEIIISIFLFLLGSIFASFFGVINYRVPRDESIIKPGSYCHNCGHELAWYENVPIFSYIFLGGKCKNCKTKIGISGLIYEIIGGLVPLFIYLKFGLNIESILLIIICLNLLLMAGFDYRTNTILDIMWIIQIILVVILFLYRVIFLHLDFVPYLVSFGIGTILFILIKLYGLFIKKMDILGTGDILVFGISCLLFNPVGVVVSLICGCVPGSIIEIIRLKTNKIDEKTEICFLPYLNFGLYIAILFTNKIASLLLGVI